MKDLKILGKIYFKNTADYMTYCLKIPAIIQNNMKLKKLKEDIST
tara:strand:- start:358 stop:492 length:135 start_codon:yes stop_codon:yes gene_type:complete